MNSKNANTAKKPLIKQIMVFRKWRKWVAVPLIVLGVLSLALPFLPGLVMIFIGIMLISPELSNKIRKSIEKFFQKK